MADFKAFFYQPESFSDSDLNKLRFKILFQRITPWLGCFSAGFFAYTLETAIFMRKTPRPIMIVPALLLGYGFAGASTF